MTFSGTDLPSVESGLQSGPRRFLAKAESSAVYAANADYLLEVRL
jgi:hypothetical protein